VLEYDIRKVLQEDQERLQLNASHHLLAYADVNILGQDIINTTRKNTEPLLEASREVGQEARTNKTTYLACVYVSLPECRTEIMIY
jgi:hypothetical protein